MWQRGVLPAIRELDLIPASGDAGYRSHLDDEARLEAYRSAIVISDLSSTQPDAVWLAVEAGDIDVCEVRVCRRATARPQRRQARARRSKHCLSRLRRHPISLDSVP